MNLDNIFKAIESKKEIEPIEIHQIGIDKESIEDITNQESLKYIDKLINSLDIYLKGGVYEINPVVILDIANRIDDTKDNKLMMLIYNIFTHHRIYGNISRKIKLGYLFQIDDIYNDYPMSTPNTVKEACSDILNIVEKITIEIL